MNAYQQMALFLRQKWQRFNRDPNNTSIIEGEGGGGSSGFQPIEIEGGMSAEDFWNEMGLFSYDTDPAFEGVTKITFNHTHLRNGIYIQDANDCEEMVFPFLETIDDDSDGAGAQRCDSLISVAMPLLEGGGLVSFGSNPNLTTFTAPLWCMGRITLISNPLLVNIDLEDFIGDENSYLYVTGAGIENLSFVANVTGSSLCKLEFASCALLESADLSNVVALKSLGIYSCNILPSIDAPNLVTIATGLAGFSNLSLSSVDFSALTTSPSQLDFTGCASLANFALPSFTDTTVNGGIQLSGCALTVASVNALLIRLAAIGYIGVVDMSGGTSATPTGAGATAKAALLLAGATVTTN